MSARLTGRLRRLLGALPPRALVMTSGGLDSTVLTFALRRMGVDTVPLFVDYGQHTARAERKTIQQVIPSPWLKSLQQVRLRDVFRASPSALVQERNLWNERIDAEDLILPYRNVVLLATAAAVAAKLRIQVVHAGFINSNHAREIDASAKFLGALRGLIDTTGSVRVRFPFRRLSKTEVARIGLALRAPIAETYSCQAASRMHCGACPNCVDRLAAFEAAE